MQRKMLNPVFTPNVMRGLTPLFFQVAYEVRTSGQFTLVLRINSFYRDSCEMRCWFNCRGTPVN